MNQAPPRSQQAPDSPCLVTLTPDMLEELLVIENACYEHPWTLGNFTDALKSGNQATALLESAQGPIMGYYIAMEGIEEAHLLNITVAPSYQKKGCARMLLEALRLWVISQRLSWIWLEVRESNFRAIHIYERFGFTIVGMRKNYYPASNGKRENALLMSLRV